MQLTSPKVHLSQTKHDWHHPLGIVPNRVIINASFNKRTSMTVYVSNKQVNNTLIAYIYQRVYIRLPRRYLFVGHVNRQWGAFAKRCINNRTMRRGWCQSCIVWERCTFGEVSCMQVIPFLCVFILDGALFGDDVKKNVRPYYIIWQKGGGFLRGLSTTTSLFPQVQFSSFLHMFILDMRSTCILNFKKIDPYSFPGWGCKNPPCRPCQNTLFRVTKWWSTLYFQHLHFIWGYIADIFSKPFI